MEDFLSREISKIQATLIPTWNDMGLPLSERQKSVEEIISTFRNVVEKVGQKKKENLIKSIDDLGEKLFHLTESLKMDAVVEPETNLSLLELEEYLREKVQDLEAEASRRIKMMQKLLREEKELCEQLCEECSDEVNEKIPSEESIAHKKRLIKTLEAEKVEREKTANGLKAAIIAHMKDLEMKPSTDLERNIVSEIDGFITLSISNIKEMKKLSKDLGNKVQENKDKENHLQEQIQVLWDRLSIDQEHKDCFFDSLTGSIIKNLALLRSELDDMEALKRANLSQFISRLRTELQELWKKCFIGEDERRLFDHLYADEVSEEVLESLEREVKRLKKFFDEHEEIFLKLIEWQMLWTKVTELEERKSDPNRLKNRGGSLLQEEKEKRRVKEKFSKLEKSLENRIRAYEEDHNRTFLIFGAGLEEFVKNQQNEYEMKKQMEINHKQEQRKKELQKEARFGAKRTHPTRSDTLRHSKFQKLGDHERGPSSSIFFRTPSRTNLAQSSNQKGIDNARILRDHANIPVSTNDATLDSSHMPSYSKFSEAIHNLCEQENIRSSVTPSTYQRRNGPRTPKGLPKTPCPPSSQQSKKKYYASSPVTLPRAAPKRRRSSRLDNSRFRSPMINSTTRTPYSPTGRRLRSNTSKFATPTRTKISFLM